jgi:hypothetical protein
LASTINLGDYTAQRVQFLKSFLNEFLLNGRGGGGGCVVQVLSVFFSHHLYIILSRFCNVHFSFAHTCNEIDCVSAYIACIAC